MGLLDKANDAGSKAEKKPAAKAIAKAKPVAKAVAKAKPVAKAVAKAKPAEQVIAQPVAAKPAKAAKAAKVKKQAKARPQGLPENFEIASANARRIAWFVNFVINLGPIFLFLFSVTILDAFTTIFALVVIAALGLNLLVVPIMSGRTLGNFVSRTKNVNSSGNKPLFFHALLVNSTGIMALLGVIFLMINVQNIFNTKGSAQIWSSVWSVLGLILIVLYFVNSSMKRNSELKQGMYDSMFGAYLVKHVPVEGEETSGFIAKLEGMATYGDRYSSRQAAKDVKRQEKAKEAAAKKALESMENQSDEKEDGSADSSNDSESTAKPKAKAKAKAKAKSSTKEDDKSE
ncbi:MAG: hypothetical protein DWC08_00370 [Candidatus Poseidoniales archaeon]|nr:MAG: hypothetical protein DWC08_00370 [Candidatus Poseidoniales archaeon]